jgi:hypothetical protein
MTRGTPLQVSVAEAAHLDFAFYVPSKIFWMMIF